MIAIALLLVLCAVLSAVVAQSALHLRCSVALCAANAFRRVVVPARFVRRLLVLALFLLCMPVLWKQCHAGRRAIGDRLANGLSL